MAPQCSRFPLLEEAACVVGVGAIPFARREARHASFAMTSDEAEILTIVCSHVRWVGCLRVVISKTLRRPVGGLYAADLPAWFPQAPGVRAANTALKKKKQNRKFRLPLTANPCGAAQNRAASVCRQLLGGMRHHKRKGGCPRTGGAALPPSFP